MGGAGGSDNDLELDHQRIEDGRGGVVGELVSKKEIKSKICDYAGLIRLCTAADKRERDDMQISRTEPFTTPLRI